MKKIVILTGAGISQESGFKTFRDANGLWEGHRVEEVATPQAFLRNPKLVHEFYNQRRAQLKEVHPNNAHLALAQWEDQHQGEFCIITQNVDDLHERAGSQNVFHMHGELRKARCLDSGEILPCDEPLKIGSLRPHICWFGEIPFYMDEIGEACREADLFLAIGTSGLVYPAAGLVSLTPAGCQRVLINKDPTDNSGAFDEVYHGLAGIEVPKFIQEKAQQSP